MPYYLLYLLSIYIHKQRKLRQAFKGLSIRKMILSPERSAHIKESFSQMRTKQELLILLNYSKSIIYGDRAVPFELKHLNYHSNPKANKKRYKQIIIKKKSGEDRRIFAPTRGLKAIQRCLNLILQNVFTPNGAATGFIQGKSILDNASVHSGSNYVYNIDLKDFFQSIDQARVWKCFQLNPFNLGEEGKVVLQLGSNIQPGSGTFITAGEKIHFSIQNNGALTVRKREKGDFGQAKALFSFHTLRSQSEQEQVKIQLALSDFSKSSRLALAAILAAICCTEIAVERKNNFGVWTTEIRNVLPQGAPTSPIISNIVCQRLDFLLSGVAKRFGLKYSRYADDITFSSPHNVYQTNGEFLTELHRIIDDQNFNIKDSKTRLQKTGYKQEVTGLTVNQVPNVPSRYIKQLRMWLYYWESYGYEKASEYFDHMYQASMSQIQTRKPSMINVIAGKLDFLKMIKGENNNTYLKLRARYVKLLPQSSSLINRQASSKVLTRNEITARSHNIERKHNPRDVADFMSLFNRRDALKYLTHDFDEEGDFDIEYFLKQAHVVFKRQTSGPLSIPNSLYSIVNQFAFTKQPEWGNYNVYKEGFSSQKWIDWSKENRLHPIRNEEFKIYIDRFRDLTRIQAPRLENIIQINLERALGEIVNDYQVDLNNLRIADFYTHIASFERAISSIFREMKNSSGQKKIEITYDRMNEGDYFVRKLSLVQFNSFPTKELGLILQEWNGDKGSMGGIRNNLMGYCNWSVETMIDEKLIRINILRDDNIPPFELIPGGDIVGFKHILTFYYK